MLTGSLGLRHMAKRAQALAMALSTDRVSRHTGVLCRVLACLLAVSALALAAPGRSLAVNPALASFETDTDATSGMALLDLASIDPAGAQTWAVVCIKPAAHSGGGFVRDAYLNVDTGKMVYGAHSTVVVGYVGTVVVLARLAGVPEASYTYYWEQPPPQPIDMGEPPPPEVALYVFAFGGTFVCTVDTALHGGKEFSPHYRIPADWVKWVKPALAYIQAQRQMFVDPKQASDRTTLSGLAKGDNPFLAVAAFRTLTRVGEPADALASMALRQTGVLQGALVALLIETEMKRNDTKAQPAVLSFIDGASAALARGVLLGAYVAKRRDPHDWTHSWLPVVEKCLKKRLQAWTVDDPDAQQIRAFLGP